MEWQGDDIDFANFLIERLKYQEAYMAISRISRQRCQSNWVLSLSQTQAWESKLHLLGLFTLLKST
jgi:hypothetical protein